MRMTNNKTVPIELLRCCIIICIGIDEVPSFQIFDRQFDLESLIRRYNIVLRIREYELARRHIVNRRDRTHGSGVAGTSADLFAVGDWLISRQTEVDKVVR